MGNRVRQVNAASSPVPTATISSRSVILMVSHASGHILTSLRPDSELNMARCRPRARYAPRMSAEDDLRPTWTPPGANPEWQAESMHELRGYSLEGRFGRHALGELLLALAYGQRSLSSEDMATASRLTVAEVAQIIQERWQHHLYCQQAGAEARVARHRVAA
jgi:hypothetical protein